MNDEVVYSNVESITFTAAGQESVILDRIPAGAQVTVTEVYSGSSYGQCLDNFQGAVTGKLVYDEEAGRWNWYSSPAQDAAGNQGEPPAGSRNE